MNLDEALETVAEAPCLLVVVDFDGVLAAIVPKPEDARPDPAAMAALESLATLPDSYVTVLSGRRLEELRHLSGSPAGITLVGSHGAEFEDLNPILDPVAESQVGSARAELGQVAAAYPGATIEPKPTGVVFHYRNVEESGQDAAAMAALSIAGRFPALRVMHGKCIVEYSASTADKGTAITALRRECAADAVVFLGDDVTDEHGFAVLTGRDVGIKVGDETTAADYRVPGPDEVVGTLERLLAARAAHATG